MNKKLLFFMIMIIPNILLGNELETAITNYISKSYRKDVSYAKEIAKAIVTKSSKYDFDPILVMSIIETESHFKQKARSRVAYGLMQINYNVWVKKKSYKNNLVRHGIIKRRKDIYDINANIHAGLHILNIKRSDCKRWDKKRKLVEYGYFTVLQCYLQRYNGGAPNYFAKVMSHYIGFMKLVIPQQEKTLLALNSLSYD